VPNISSSERRKRLSFGILTLVISLIILIALLVIGAERWWRLALFLLFFGATVGFFQWREKT
jgi:fatty acid desaturase